MKERSFYNVEISAHILKIGVVLVKKPYSNAYNISGIFRPALITYRVVIGQFYRALNIRVPLIGLEVWTDRDQCIINEEPNSTLWSFLQWRQKLKSRKKHDNAQLLTSVMSPYRS